MIISEQTARLIWEAISYSINRISEDTFDESVINDITKECMTDFCNFAGITEVELEDSEEDEEDIPDDVDETNYDPYLGQDFYE